MGINGFLKQVLTIKATEISRAKSAISLGTIRQDAEQTAPAADFLSALRQSRPGDIGIIAEIKKASPSKGEIRPDLDLDIYTQACEQGGARAISVLTESRYFKGRLQDLEWVCGHTSLPVLRKDFIISAYQIYEAKRAGAAAVLLITTILSPDQLHDYICLVREIGMEPLVEITSEKEFETAHQAGAAIVDINNRNLMTLETDLTVSRRIAAIIPDDVVPVAASGIKTRSDINLAIKENMFNFLVGESIVRSDDPKAFIAMLRDED